MTQITQIENEYTITQQDNLFFDDIQDELGADILDETSDEIISREGRYGEINVTQQANDSYSVTEVDDEFLVAQQNDTSYTITIQ